MNTNQLVEIAKGVNQAVIKRQQAMNHLLTFIKDPAMGEVVSRKNDKIRLTQLSIKGRIDSS